MKIAEYESAIPGFGAAVEGVRDQLSDEGCLFFFQQDEAIADDLLVAYVFVGRQNPRPSSCLHSGILKSFGVQRKAGDNSPYADRFLVDLIGMQLIDHCSQAHGGAAGLLCSGQDRRHSNNEFHRLKPPRHGRRSGIFR